MSHEKLISQREVSRRYKRMLQDEEPIADDKFNCYTCGTCEHITKTIDRADGTTPFVMDCEVCKTPTAMSSFYEDKKPEAAPTWEWVRPTLAETMKLRKHPETLEHVLLGGLIIRKIENAASLRVV